MNKSRLIEALAKEENLSLKKAEEVAEPSDEVKLLTEIRDALKK